MEILLSKDANASGARNAQKTLTTSCHGMQNP
jgi:hypothetical protein